MRVGSSTSAPPTALLQAQVSATEAVRADVLGQLDSIDSKIQQKELELHALMSQQQLLRDQIATMDRALEIHRRSLTPILILPADILAYLFHLVIDEYVATSMDNSYLYLLAMGDYRAFAFNVAAVCRKWRHFALAMPSIWARIWLDLSKLTLYEPDSHLRVTRARAWKGYLNTCLTRSGNSPLYLFLTEVQHTMDDDYETHSYRAAMCQIFDAAGRWRVCRMTTSHSLRDEGSKFVSNLQLRTPLLEHFLLHYPAGIHNTVTPIPTPCRFLPFAPRLRSLYIPFTLACHTFSSMPKVKELEFRGGGPDNCTAWLGAFQLLERCPALERWTVGDVYNFNSASTTLDAPSSKYALQHLTALHLHDNDYDLLASWSDALSFPALQHLTLDDYTNTLDVHPILNGIAADSHVATLIVRCVESFDDMDLSRLMAHFPELREIRIKAFTLYEDDFSQLLAKDSAGRRWRVCPDLRTFAMVDTLFDNEDVVTGFLDFVRARAACASHVPPVQDAPDSRCLESVDMGKIVGNETIPLWLPEAVRGILRGDTDLHISA